MRGRLRATLLAGLVLLPACGMTVGPVYVLSSDRSCLGPFPGESQAQANLRRLIEHYAVPLDRVRSVEVSHRHGGRFDFTYCVTGGDSAALAAYPAGEEQRMALARAIYRPFLVAEDATVSERSWEGERGTWSFSGMEADWRVVIARRNTAFPGNNATLYLDTQRHLAKIVVDM